MDVTNCGVLFRKRRGILRGAMVVNTSVGQIFKNSNCEESAVDGQNFGGKNVGSSVVLLGEEIKLRV